MHIDAIEVFHVALPYRKSQSTPWGESAALQTVLVRMESGGTAGWGEASPGTAPNSGPDWAGGTFACIRDWLAPLVAGQTIDSGEGLQERLAGIRGNRFAKAAVDMAWWDLQARIRGEPLHQLLGGQKAAIDVGTSFDQMETIDELIEAIGQAFAAGYARVELKFRPGWDVPMVNAVRHTFPIERFHVDVEGGLRLDYMELLCRLDDFSLAMVEQPLPADDLVGHAMVQEAIRTPVCLDESITTVEQAEMALELHSAKYINVKPGRVGGITPAIAIHDACHHECVACWVAAMPQSSIGSRAGLALASKANFSYPADLFPSEQILEADLAPPPAAIRDASDGVLRVPLWSEPGLGVEPNRELLERWLLERAKR